MSKAYEIEITEDAIYQMYEIKRYISRILYEPMAAQRLIDEMDKKIRNLSSSPYLYPVVKEKELKKYNVRKFKVKNYYIYYMIFDEEKIVRVIAVIYARRDQLRSLMKMNLW